MNILLALMLHKLKSRKLPLKGRCVCCSVAFCQTRVLACYFILARTRIGQKNFDTKEWLDSCLHIHLSIVSCLISEPLDKTMKNVDKTTKKVDQNMKNVASV